VGLRELVEGLSSEEQAVAAELLAALVRSRGGTPLSGGLVLELTGAQKVDEAPGLVRYRLPVRPHLLNPYGVLAGPVLYTVMDYSMGAAMRTVAAEGERSATVEIKVNYLRPVTAGEVTVETRVLHRGRAIAVLESRATDGEGRLVAVALGTFRVLGPG